MKLGFFDVETTNTNPCTGEMNEISMIIDQDKKPLKVINRKFRPINFDTIEQKALDIQGITIEELEGYPDRDESFQGLINDLDEVIDKYDSSDKLFAVAHNLWFDRGFLHELFRRYNIKHNTKHYFFSYFHVEGFDTIPLMTQLNVVLGNHFDNMRLGTLCKALKIDFDDSKAHSSMYDTKKLRKLFYKADRVMDKILNRGK